MLWILAHYLADIEPKLNNPKTEKEAWERFQLLTKSEQLLGTYKSNVTSMFRAKSARIAKLIQEEAEFVNIIVSATVPRYSIH